MAYLGVFNFDRVFARLAFLRRPATGARTAVGIPQTKNGFQDSIVDIVSGAMAENDSDGCWY